METNGIQERVKFAKDHCSGLWSMTELCERYGVSRTAGYGWLERYKAEGEGGLEERSRAPHVVPHRTATAVEERILELRREYGWGAKKLLQILGRREPEVCWPAQSTVNAILERHGQLRRNRRRKRWAHPGAAPLRSERPNQVWPADFKGQFKMGDGRYCYPLTVTDHFSRKLLVCRGLPSVEIAGSKLAFLWAFREYGLPDAIRTDNGTPFASVGIRGLSRLNVWWMQLGIAHQRIRPASPQENGQHERMHKDLKREATRPPAANQAAQQRKLDAFRRRYNQERPHDGIGGAIPNEKWEPSQRPYPEGGPTPPTYARHLETRRVSAAGTFRIRNHQLFLSMALVDQDIALEEISDRVWNIVYYQTLLGRVDENTRVITGA